jgi:positive regulator of sigma E activity
MRPWLFPLAVLLVVVAVAFAPSPVIGAVGAVTFLALGYVVVPLYHLR